ncbi:hypothetical protein Tco_0537853 [Tanacetum coccineum]
MSEKEDTYHDTILDLEAKLKKNVDLFLKLGNSLQGMFMLGPKPLSVYDQQLKHGNLEIPLNVRDSEDILEDAFKNFVPQKELSVEQKYFSSSSIPSVKIPVSKNMPSESPLIKELDKIKVGFEKLSLLIQQNCKRASIFYTSPAEIEINDFCQDQVKPILNELKVYLECFQNLFQRDIKEMKDVFESTESELDELEKQNELLKDQLLEASLKHDVELCVLINHECVDKILNAELEKVKKKSFKIQEDLQARIKILEKDVQRCEKQSVDFQLKLQHEKEKQKWDSTSKNKISIPLDYSWISKMEKLEDENVSLDFTVQSLIKERDNAKMEYKKLFDSIKKTRSQTQKEMDELIVHVSEKTYAYGAIRAENQNLLTTISELKKRLAKAKKVIIMAQQQHAAHVHPDELCPPNKRYDLMDFNKKVDLEHVQYRSKYRLGFMLDKKELTLTLDDFRQIFHLPQATANNHNSSVPPPSFSNMVPFYKQIMQMLYFFVNNIHVDYAELLWEGLYYSLHHPTSSILYPRFTKIIVSHYMTIFPEISRRVRDMYHNLQGDDIMKNIFNSGRHKNKVGMQIPAWMITDEMKLTEHYQIYAEVTPSAPRSPNPDKQVAESSAPRRSIVIHLRLPERRSTRLTPPAPVPTVDKADEMILQDTLQVSLAEHKSREEQEARENVALVDEHLASKEIEKMVDGQENIVDDSSIPRNDESNIPGTRIEPRSDKESLEVEIAKEKEVELSNVVIPVNLNDEDEEITDEAYELKRREKGKIIEETRNSPIPTPIRSPRIHTNLVSSDTEKLQELTDTPHTTSSSSSPQKKLAKTNRLLSLFKTKPTRFKRYKSFFHELQGRYGYLFAHLQARFVPRKSLDTLADNLHDVMVETLPVMVDKHIKDQVVKQVPKQVRNQVLVYVAKGLILERQKAKEERERLIAKAILQQFGNIQAQIQTYIDNAIANVIPSQVDASVRSYMYGHILHVHPAQSETSSVLEQQYQLYLAMKVDPQLQQQDIAIWLALQMKFERYTVLQTACRTYAVRPRDQDDPHDDAHPEGENSAKQQDIRV